MTNKWYNKVTNQSALIYALAAVIVAIIGGFFGLISKCKQDKFPKNCQITVLEKMTKLPIQDVLIHIPELDIHDLTNQYGKFDFEVMNNTHKSLKISLSKNKYEDLCIIKSIDSLHQSVFFLKRKDVYDSSQIGPKEVHRNN